MRIKPSQKLIKKSYEISYALFRVASVARVRHGAFADRMEKNALDLIHTACGSKCNTSSDLLRQTKYVLRLATDIGIIHHANTKALFYAIDEFWSEVDVLKKNAESIPELTSESLFPEDKVEEVPERTHLDQGNIANSGNESGKAYRTEKTEPNKRHPAIIERIRQNGNCRVSEIREVLPDISERTLRYDLRKLSDQGLIERFGNGGPATFYRATQNA